MAKLKLIHASEQVIGDGIQAQERYYKLGETKFKICYENSNGSPLGFNYKKCVSIFDPTTCKWNNAHDNKAIPQWKGCSYYSNDGERVMKEFFTEMEKFVEKIYG